MNSLDKVTAIKGVGPKKAELLSKLNIVSIEDLIYNFPRSYEDRRTIKKIAELEEGNTASFRATIEHVIAGAYSSRRWRSPTRVTVSDETGMIELVFFNASYLAKTLKKGSSYVFFGTVTRGKDRLQIVHPDFSREEDAIRGILPVYSLTKGITQKEMRKLQQQVMGFYGQVEDVLSPETIQSNNLCCLEYALQNIHFPENKQKLLEARYRLIFDEFMVLQTGLMISGKYAAEIQKGIKFHRDRCQEDYIQSLSYELTGAQRRCTDQIMADLESEKRMNRLVQGDVGSGKTVIAEIAMYKAFRNGYQSVLMAPTEILAKQHYEELKKTLSPHGIRVGFLSGSMKTSEKNKLLEELKDGAVQVVTGTHALIQPNVIYNNLGLVITDEQHRFGVGQRMLLREKGDNPNVLVMTATPIPRTLAVIFYGDLDISVVDELPPGRQVIDTKCISNGDLNTLKKERNKCYDFVERELSKGHQAYVVAPLIEESESLDIKSAVELHEELRNRFPSYEIGLVHGAMKQAEKDSIMQKFHDRRIDVLVATVVIEVGINVPNATVMVIENAERFGLAQLHQLRGRVGRGKDKSYCFLITEGNSELAVERGKIMESSSDGFYIAEEDLRLRGPGEIFGTRQHGIPDLKLADLSRHLDVLGHVKTEAEKLLEDDPGLGKPENRTLKRRIQSLFGDDFTLNL